MKTGIHPEYVECTVTCACGESFVTHSTKPEVRIDVCSKCHPFFTGQQKIVDTEGRVERFIKRYGMQDRYAEYSDEGKKSSK
jgi:large subunit ribosomal protein L31